MNLQKILGVVIIFTNQKNHTLSPSLTQLDPFQKILLTTRRSCTKFPSKFSFPTNDKKGKNFYGGRK